MKKIIFLASTVLLTLSCSSDDDLLNQQVPPIPDYTYSTKITPPSWIHGTWKRIYNGSVLTDGFRFYTDDFCHFDPFADYCWKNFIENVSEDKFVQEISENRYKLFQVYSGRVIEHGIYNEFVKISDTEMIRISSSSTDLFDTYVKQ